EDKVLHKMDDNALGRVMWVAHNFFVTDAGTDHSIQHAIEIASDGDTINVEAGLYSENLTIDKSLTLNGANAGIAADSSTRLAESRVDHSGIVVTLSDPAENVTIDGMELVGDVGVSSTAILAGVAVPKFLDISNSRINADG